jgi:hypothetical protein
MPDMPGIWMSRNMTSGACASSARSTSMPSPASAQTTSSGQIFANVSRNSSRNTDSSLAITAFNGLIASLRRQ